MNAGRFAQHVVVERPGEITPRAAWLIQRLLWPVLRVCFRPTLSGLENLPTSGPYLLVANHSAGVGLAELLSFAGLWVTQRGSSHRIAGFALPLGFVLWPFSALHREVGTVPSTYRAAEETLAKGVPLLVFPGGDHESLKPIWEVDRVDFCGRVGFLRIAHDAGVPIVPLGITNGAWTAPILLRGKWLSWLLVTPRLMGVKRWGVSLLGIVGAAALLAWLPVDLLWRLVAAWLWLGSPATFFPIFPATLRFRVGAPIPASTLFGPDGPSPDTLRAALRTVEDAVEKLVRTPADAPPADRG